MLHISLLTTFATDFPEAAHFSNLTTQLSNSSPLFRTTHVSSRRVSQAEGITSA
jgi:hypothetical protein